jgi:polyisoprenoid-binding protein YceI
MKRILLAVALSLAAASALAAPLTYQLDANHTNVTATWSHFGFSNPSAHFGQAEGTLVYDADDVAKSSVEVTLPLSGMTGFAAKFDEHLNSGDFFDSAKYPNAKFKSTRVEAAGEGKLKVTGDLTIKDKTNPVVLDVTLNKAGAGTDGQPRVGFDATATVSRTAFGLGMAAPAVSDEVKLRITTEAAVPKTDAAK